MCIRHQKSIAARHQRQRHRLFISMVDKQRAGCAHQAVLGPPGAGGFSEPEGRQQAGGLGARRDCSWRLRLPA